MTDPLATYRGMRDPSRTPEPVPPAGPLPEGNDDTFVIQEHHARSLHWDVRLERDGVLVSWAVPKGLPLDPKTNHLAVHTEDHPIDYGSFEGEIPPGEYGGGKVILWDRGHYELGKWTDREVKVVFHGARSEGRYVFFQTRGRDWMVHRMDPPPIEGWEPVPVGVRPMTAVPGSLPDGEQWAYELAWGGVRLLIAVEGGRTRMTDAAGEDVGAYPELREIGPALGHRVCLLDGEVVTLGRDGRPSTALLRRRPAGRTAPDARSAREVPVTYLIFDLLHLDGVDVTGLPYGERRVLLEELVPPGDRWSVAPALPGPGADAIAASQGLGLDGIVAKRVDSTYRVGRRSRDWTLVVDRAGAADRRRNAAAADRPTGERDVVIGGWVADADGLPRALLVGVPGASRLEYVGTVRGGFATDRADLRRRLARLSRKTSPFAYDGDVRARNPRWVRPTVGARVVTTPSGALSWRGFT